MSSAFFSPVDQFVIDNGYNSDYLMAVLAWRYISSLSALFIYRSTADNQQQGPIRPVPPQSSLHTTISGLKSRLEAILAGSATVSQLESVVRICHANAVGALVRRGHLAQLTRLHGLKFSDMAYDCIAEIFARDGRGKYLVLESYFCAHEMAVLTDREVYLHLQRLTFMKVRQGLYRLYGEMDPQLGKILRNIKAAVRSLDLFVEIDRLGDTWLAPSLCDPAKTLSPLDTDELTRWLCEEASGSEFIPELLARLALRLRQQQTHSRMVSIVSMGLAIRAFYKQKQVPMLAEPSVVLDEGSLDVPRAIEDACRSVRMRTFPKYVRAGKMHQVIFDAYFVTIAQMLEARFVRHDGKDFQLSTSFLGLVPGVTPDEYRKKHRNKLEYLARLAHEHVSQRLGEK